MANKQQSSCIVHNHYACTVGAAYTVAAIKGSCSYCQLWSWLYVQAVLLFKF